MVLSIDYVLDWGWVSLFVMVRYDMGGNGSEVGYVTKYKLNF